LANKSEESEIAGKDAIQSLLLLLQTFILFIGSRGCSLIKFIRYSGFSIKIYVGESVPSLK